MFLDSKKETISISFCPPSIFARTRKGKSTLSPYSAPAVRSHFALTPAEVSECDLIVSFARTYFQQNSD
jgi:hypothetical protein